MTTVWPLERLVEKRRKVRAQEAGREAFIRACLDLSHEVEADYEAILEALGLERRLALYLLNHR